jgi:hypothetical protein
MEIQNNQNKINNAIDSFLIDTQKTTQEQQEMDCDNGVCVIKNDKSILERINKKIIVEDGRQLLI